MSEKKEVKAEDSASEKASQSGADMTGEAAPSGDQALRTASDADEEPSGAAESDPAPEPAKVTEADTQANATEIGAQTSETQADARPSETEVEVEPEPMAPTEPAGHHVSAHLPPPPPSARVQGATSRLEVRGNPRVASDLMTRKIFTIQPDDVIAHLEEQMQAFRFRHLPVVENHKLVGLITHRDLLHASSSFLSPKAKERDELIHKLPARRIMQTELITARPNDTLVEVARLMWEAKIGCVLVTEEDGTLVGVITEADFIRLAHHYLARDERSSGS